MPKPAFLERSKQMHLSDVVGLLCLTEKFRFEDLFITYIDKDGNVIYIGVNEIDSFSPVYKSLYDKYLGADSKKYVEEKSKDKEKFYHIDSDTKDKLPVFRTFFDWTSGFARDPFMEGENSSNPLNGNNWPLQVEIRIEFSEPRTDTIQAIGSRKFLRGGVIQFLITAPIDVVEYIKTDNQDKYVIGKPMGSIFRIAQYYIDKYGSTDAMQLLGDIPDIKEGLEQINPGKNQFEDTTLIRREQIMGILFPESDFDHIHYVKKDVRKNPQDPENIIWVKDPGNLSVIHGATVTHGYTLPDPAIGKEGDYYVLIHKYMTLIDRVKSFRTIAAVVTNIRFVPKDRHPVRLFNSTYGLAVSIPFTFEQQK